MPVVTFGCDDLHTLLGHKVDLETLLDRVPQLGADIHSYDEKTDSLSIEFFPDRPDLYCVEGAATALRAFLGFAEGLQQYPVGDSKIVLRREESVNEVRPHIVAGVVLGVSLNDSAIKSLMELQEKLHITMGRKRSKVAIGIHDLDKITPPFTYKAVDPDSVSFVPLAKTECMSMREILTKHEKGKAYAHLLENKPLFPLIVDAEEQVISFPPIINGALTTVTVETKNIFIDVTGTDFNAVNGALNIVAAALAERGGAIQTVTVEGTSTFKTPDLQPRSREIAVAQVNSLLGCQLDAAGVCAALKKMGYGCESLGDKVCVQIPATRLDILHDVDVIEDVAKGYGYENFGNVLPSFQTFGSELNETKAANILRQLLIGYGYLETTTLTLTSEDAQFTKMKLPETEVVAVLNPISEDHTCLRVSLIPSQMALLRKNKHRDLPQRLFEIGDVVIDAVRHKHLAAVSISVKSSFTEIKSLVESVLRDLSVTYEIQPSSLGMFIPGRGAEIISAGKSIGVFGEIHPEVITNFELRYPVVAFELDAEALTDGKLERVA
ncbi:phenylalanine--tRNA ligase subunit beta [Candidatus Methanomassiliicoccus intestinalis]|uniref:phenylalanine--tRNA ligase subunit beta n=1 Tax=Candidatus Methanomassiliicoccus intestinalis TaxID=1406512 RepID=UPI0037DDC6D3